MNVKFTFSFTIYAYSRTASSKQLSSPSTCQEHRKANTGWPASLIITLEPGIKSGHATDKLGYPMSALSVFKYTILPINITCECNKLPLMCAIKFDYIAI